VATKKVFTKPAEQQEIRPFSFEIDAEHQTMLLGFRNVTTGETSYRRYEGDDFTAILAQFPQLAALKNLCIDIAVFMGDEDGNDWT